MKIVIELNDNDLRLAISEQVGKAISGLATEAIQKQVDDILEKKFSRIGKGDVDSAVKDAATKLVRGDNNQWRLDGMVKTALSDAARALIKGGGE
ncbi:hypothetical protein [Rhodoferax mekongensis]|uniref:Uncharacterized protein n=1 Tax=Rhodoferax mekongensis TaxID=3068341 RepID=A0ABZ0B310_9BURK|nr:hypothetical protein [Rhodoferax sp. TBRC 17307]WNO06005.1 hypothetical protein RAN89_06135 [Rhodoferax sp. TBRC 17307]